MIKTINWFITDQNVVVNYEGQTHIVKRSDPLASDLISAIKENRLNDVPNLVSVAQAMEHKSKGDVLVRDGEVFVKGVKVPTELARKIQQFIDQGLPYQPLIKFAENLQNNPSFRAVNELFQFLEKNDHAFTENGTFLAFKKVRSNFTDVHTGTFDNHPGQILEMPRNQVDEDPNSHCSRGFHAGNYRYCHEFGDSNGIMLEVEINPADVVSVPNDLNEKIRVCKYKVLGVVNTNSAPLPKPLKNVNDLNKINTCIECGCETSLDYDMCGDCEDEYLYDEDDTNNI